MKIIFVFLLISILKAQCQQVPDGEDFRDFLDNSAKQLKNVKDANIKDYDKIIKACLDKLKAAIEKHYAEFLNNNIFVDEIKKIIQDNVKELEVILKKNCLDKALAQLNTLINNAANKILNCIVGRDIEKCKAELKKILVALVKDVERLKKAFIQCVEKECKKFKPKLPNLRKSTTLSPTTSTTYRSTTATQWNNTIQPSPTIPTSTTTTTLPPKTSTDININRSTTAIQWDTTILPSTTRPTTSTTPRSRSTIRSITTLAPATGVF